MNNRTTTRQQRKTRISAKVRGTSDRPRLSIFRSNRSFYAQIIDDTRGITLLGVTIVKKEGNPPSRKATGGQGTKSDLAKELGKKLAAKAKDKKISRVVFDKSLYKYHGRVKSFAEGAREGGLQF